MNDTIDFDRLAQRIADLPDDPMQIRDSLRLLWNARGAADVAKLDAALAAAMGVSASGPFVKILDRALRTLDR